MSVSNISLNIHYYERFIPEEQPNIVSTFKVSTGNLANVPLGDGITLLVDRAGAQQLATLLTTAHAQLFAKDMQDRDIPEIEGLQSAPAATEPDVPF